VDDYSNIFVASSGKTLIVTAEERQINVDEAAFFSELRTKLGLERDDILEDGNNHSYPDTQPICSVLFANPSAKIVVRRKTWLFKLVEGRFTTDVSVPLPARIFRHDIMDRHFECRGSRNVRVVVGDRRLQLTASSFFFCAL
jgi:hypothetical protein